MGRDILARRSDRVPGFRRLRLWATLSLATFATRENRIFWRWARCLGRRRLRYVSRGIMAMAHSEHQRLLIRRWPWGSLRPEIFTGMGISTLWWRQARGIRMEVRS